MRRREMTAHEEDELAFDHALDLAMRQHHCRGDEDKRCPHCQGLGQLEEDAR